MHDVIDFYVCLFCHSEHIRSTQCKLREESHNHWSLYFRMKIKLPKVRKLWKINPRARIKQSRKVYSRRKAREEKGKLEAEEDIAKKLR